MTQDSRKELLQNAARYLWWEKPGDATRRPLRIVAQVMNMGDFEDVQRLLAVLGAKVFREALAKAEPGWFNDRSWSYWSYRLGLTAAGEPLPPMPERGLDR